MDLLRAMEAFVSTVRTGSMSAAARELGQSSAMVGQHIVALEARLGTKLLNRTTRRQSLTDFGESYYDQCRDILGRVALADEAAESQQTRAEGRLRITAPTTFGSEALLPALPIYRDLAPDVTLDITLTDRNVDIVEEGFDIAFRIGALRESSVIARPLRPYHMAIAASPGYLTKRGTPGRPEDLSGHDAVAFTASSTSAWRFARNGEEIHVDPLKKTIVNSGRAVVVGACAGLGVILQPEILLRREFEEGRLVRLLEGWDVGQRPMALLYYRDRRMTPRLRSFIQFAVAQFGMVETKP
jgi:DNA-binding transcriptional LysR family regulator